MEIKHIKYEIADRLSKIEANLGNRKYKDKQEYLKGAYFELEDLKDWIYERESKDSTSEQLEHDALLGVSLHLEFAEWISKNMWTNYESKGNGILEKTVGWYNTYNINIAKQILNTKQLYDLFISERGNDS